MSSFGHRMRERRLELDMSQQALAEKIFLKSGKQTISRWEQDLSEPSQSETLAIADALNVSLDWLMRGITPAYVEEPSSEYIRMPKDELIDLQRRALKNQQIELDRQGA
jgi:transcriptional regulator with XRE-family HTH domain